MDVDEASRRLSGVQISSSALKGNAFYMKLVWSGARGYKTFFMLMKFVQLIKNKIPRD